MPVSQMKPGAHKCVIQRVVNKATEACSGSVGENEKALIMK